MCVSFWFFQTYGFENVSDGKAIKFKNVTIRRYPIRSDIEICINLNEG